jgi:hypothetical protein
MRNYTMKQQEPHQILFGVSYSRRAVKIHTILTENGIQFTNRRRDILAFMTPFDRICRKHGIEHRLTKVKHPWTDGRVDGTKHLFRSG